MKPAKKTRPCLKIESTNYIAMNDSTQKEKVNHNWIWKCVSDFYFILQKNTEITPTIPNKKNLESSFTNPKAI